MTTATTLETARTEEQSRPSQHRAPRSRRRIRPDLVRSRLLAWTALLVIGLFALLPLYWMLVTALSPADRVFQFPPDFVPGAITFENFRAVLDNGPLFHYLKNSVIVSLTTAFLSVVISTYMGYSFSKFRYRGRKSLMNFVLASQMFPQSLLLITLYALFRQFGMLGSYTALVLSFSTFTLPLCVWMLKGIFDTIPDALLEAAAIDGASRWRTLHSVIAPLAAPGMAAAGLFAFVRGWNDFVFALSLSNNDTMTLPPGLVHTYIGETSTSWPTLMAASLVVSLPVVVAFMFLQRFLVGGLTAGSVK
ncbi:carbohydrate ABC transporter permease [Streptomyces sp. NPDC047981]|uniref:carbohydrate ABC transporter permease n=1 Tax=Streptomyces sp. NPDC047981 TaxID=3154610 RepID=UPI003439D488